MGPGRFPAVRARGIVVVALGIAIVLALSAASPVLGSPALHRRQTVIPPSRYTSFVLRGTNGFQVFVSTAGSSHVAVELFSGSDYVSYLAPASISHDRVEARIGSLGRIAMRYEPSGSWRPSTEPQGQCRGRIPRLQNGVFLGHFNFRGERGFTTAGTTRVRAFRRESFREVCKGGGRNGFGEQPPLKPNVIATATLGGRAVSVELFLKPEELSTHASVREKRGSLLIERTIGIAGEDSRYAEQSDGSVLVTPPPPFRGEADYRPGASGGRVWTGTLAAPFPGLGVVPLAGGDFSVSQPR